MRKSKGFTLIELMVVILIVAILAAVLAPMMGGRIREAKWTEGKAAAGTLATAIRAWCAEHEGSTDAESGATIAGTWTASTDATLSLLGIDQDDLTGKYFVPGDYTVTVNAADFDANPRVDLTYSIAIRGAAIGDAQNYTLDQAGAWTKAAP